MGLVKQQNVRNLQLVTHSIISDIARGSVATCTGSLQLKIHGLLKLNNPRRSHQQRRVFLAQAHAVADDAPHPLLKLIQSFSHLEDISQLRWVLLMFPGFHLAEAGT